MSDFNRAIIDEFRANSGQVGGEFAGATLILLHHVGAKSGIERVTPVGAFPQPDGKFAIIASNGGSATSPNWYFNLTAHPAITVEFGAEEFRVKVRELEGEERERVWRDALRSAPQLGAYARDTARKIPVLLLTRDR